jgi:hypothetical protein
MDTYQLGPGVTTHDCQYQTNIPHDSR